MSTPQFTVSQRVQRAVLIALSRMPAFLQQVLAKPPVNSAGDRMPADIALLMKLSAGGDDYADMSATAGRETTERDLALFSDHVAPCAIEEEVQIGNGLLATRYSSGGNHRSLIVFFHGGGFVLGSRESYTTPARMLAHGTHADVLSVEYRLAPEHPFPAAHDDALAAWRYVLAHARKWGIDPHQVAVAGESAGGNIAAVLCQHVRADPVQPVLQVLIQPVTDILGRRPSQDEFASSPALSAKQINWFMKHYLPAGTDYRDPRVSPLLARDLRDLPPTIVAIGGFDPLRDDGLAYAEALREAGVPTDIVHEPGQVHGFLSFTAVSPSCKQATERIVQAVAEALNKITSTTNKC
ncbi:alpha/beta hydrolase [Rhodococcus sp. USK13]|uniref:alpha/beta hydrolase n=1 Tax=Rhodococcus sp. USK13 TaxID=2806442 RepID=UPI001BCB0D48|nr:alpha/beta hydrolase [Rhodococcus sp. USK13]